MLLMNSEHNNEAQPDALNRVADTAAALLQEQRESIDAPTLSRLNQARQKALMEMDRKPSLFGKPSSWLPAGVVTMMALLVAGVSFDVLQLDPVVQPMEARQAEKRSPDVPNLEMMFADEGFDMLEELDFYLWLEEEQTTGKLYYSYEVVT
jgi:hypothetical protein